MEFTYDAYQRLLKKRNRPVYEIQSGEELQFRIKLDEKQKEAI